MGKAKGEVVARIGRTDGKRHADRRRHIDGVGQRLQQVRAMVAVGQGQPQRAIGVDGAVQPQGDGAGGGEVGRHLRRVAHRYAAACRTIDGQLGQGGTAHILHGHRYPQGVADAD